MFTKEERSRFNYWFAHWCAFQMTALNCKGWRAKYLFHDIEKPFMRLLLDYKKVQKFHRTHHNHHPEWLEKKLRDESVQTHAVVEYWLDQYDFKATAIDWECGHFTKVAQPRNAYQEYQHVLEYSNFSSKYPLVTKYCYNEFSRRMIDAIKELGLYPIAPES